MKITIDGRTFIGALVTIEPKAYFILTNNRGETFVNGWVGRYRKWIDITCEPGLDMDPVKFETLESALEEANEWEISHEGLVVTVVELTQDTIIIEEEG